MFSFCTIGFITIWGICWDLFSNHLVWECCAVNYIMGHVIWDKPGILDHKLSSELTLDLCLNLFFNVLLPVYSYCWIPHTFGMNLANLTMKHVVFRVSLGSFGFDPKTWRFETQKLGHPTSNCNHNMGGSVPETNIFATCKLMVGKLPTFLLGIPSMFSGAMLVSRRGNLVLLTVNHLVAQ